MLVEEQLQGNIRDWIVLAFSAALLLWTSTGKYFHQNKINDFFISFTCGF